MATILSAERNYQAELEKIELQTKNRIDIDNYQNTQISHLEMTQAAVLPNRFPDAIPRTEFNPFYDCHGLTFANRRTSIDETTEINKILHHDNYELVDMSRVLEGDIVLYKDETGDIKHSGIVVKISRESPIYPLIHVVSKWGKYKEFIHRLHDCPYPNTNKVFYRPML